MIAKNNPDSTFDPSAAARPGSGIFGLRSTRKTARVHLIPVPFDATTSYRDGAARAPAAIRKASVQIDLYDLDGGRPYESGIWMMPEPSTLKTLNEQVRPRAKRVIAAGGDVAGSRALVRDRDAVDHACERMNDWVMKASAKSLDDGRLVGVVGGDHSTPYGLIAALAARHADFGILHFDAHHDLRAAFEGFTWSHASIMHNVVTRLPAVTKLVQVGIRDFCEEEAEMVRQSDRRIIAHYDQEMQRALFSGVSFDRVADAIVAELPDEVYVSFDIDGLDPKLCPNTGTPVPGGLDFAQAVHVVDRLVKSGRRIIGFDVNEVAPGKDEWDACVGARLLYKLIGYALLR